VLDTDYVRLLDFLVIGTRGYVSPEAETIALRVLQQNPESLGALYYAGLMYAQNDRPDRAFNLWRRIVENGDQQEFHWRLAAGQIEDVALQLGMDYALPARRGPSAQDLAAAEDMSAEDRQAPPHRSRGRNRFWRRCASGHDDPARSTRSGDRRMIFEDPAAFATALPNYAPLAGLDLGTKTIGVSVSDAGHMIATPLETIKRTKFQADAAALLKITEHR